MRRFHRIQSIAPVTKPNLERLTALVQSNAGLRRHTDLDRVLQISSFSLRGGRAALELGCRFRGSAVPREPCDVFRYCLCGMSLRDVFGGVSLWLSVTLGVSLEGDLAYLQGDVFKKGIY